VLNDQDAGRALQDRPRVDRPYEQELSPGHKTADAVVDETTARTGDYNERNNQLTGQLVSMTVELR
jgi:hypothetical protein